MQPILHNPNIQPLGVMSKNLSSVSIILLEVINSKKITQNNLDKLKVSLKTSAATVMLDQNSVGRLSRMDAIQLQQMAIESARRNENNLLQIKAALIRIDNDDYGYYLRDLV